MSSKQLEAGALGFAKGLDYTEPSVAENSAEPLGVASG